MNRHVPAFPESATSLLEPADLVLPAEPLVPERALVHPAPGLPGHAIDGHRECAGCREEEGPRDEGPGGE